MIMPSNEKKGITVKIDADLSGSVELKKFDGKVTKPNATDYQTPAFMGGGSDAQ